MVTAMMNPMAATTGTANMGMGMGMPMPASMTPNMVMVPRCTMKVEKCAGGMKMTCVCDDPAACTMMQNLCAMMAGGMCSVCCTMNGMTVCCCNMTMAMCKCEMTANGCCLTCTSGDKMCCDMIQACCDCIMGCMKAGCACCVMMGGTPVCCCMC
ncbi:hypothetical protein [Frigoriglobus tundricola]|uniref:Uncharacterized protein n=1 Tax=Frigoriglobus tundricola TaxID=2774151 RepID=A0A6M5Z6V5_9BACT|nr:hypothetical protein [Frigoriglobus tundricola]QJX01124.1 hypothetical protein FTUN_8763 [Frigoriglobus tundricola]